MINPTKIVKKTLFLDGLFKSLTLLYKNTTDFEKSREENSTLR